VAPCRGRVRAASLTGIRDPARGLRDLLAILTEAGTALVTVVCAMDDEAGHWSCVESVDAVAESRDRARVLWEAYAAGGVDAMEGG
jgi:hypothetical protein